MSTEPNSTDVEDDEKYPSNFIRTIIEKDVAAGKNSGQVVTRFPPEPNGFLHIGHAKAICLSFGMAKEFAGTTYLRFDDTNPSKESIEFADSMKEDISWLGFEWLEVRNASDYFDQIITFAFELVKSEKAFVCKLSQEESRILKEKKMKAKDKDSIVIGKVKPKKDSIKNLSIEYIPFSSTASSSFLTASILIIR